MYKCCYLSLLAYLTVTSGQQMNTKIVKAGGDLQLSCEANEPIHWCYPEIYATPDISETVNYTSPVSIMYSNPRSHTYKITIDIKNISYIYTGFYHCVRNDSQDLCSREVKSLRRTYVYVEDDTHLLIVKPFKRVWAYKNETAILPCLPTHPNINVTLSKGGLQVQLGKQDSGMNISYDPTLGFIIGPVEKKEVAYVCNATRGQQSEAFIIDIDIAESGTDTELSPPLINGTSKLEKNVTVMEGESLYLPCHSIQSEQMSFDIKWNFPNSSKVEITRHQCHSPGHSCKNYTLALNDITPEDDGKYVCMVMSPPHKPEEASFELHVIQKNTSKDFDAVNVGSMVAHNKLHHLSDENDFVDVHHTTDEDVSEFHDSSVQIPHHSNSNIAIPHQSSIVLILLYILYCVATSV